MVAHLEGLGKEKNMERAGFREGISCLSTPPSPLVAMASSLRPGGSNWGSPFEGGMDHEERAERILAEIRKGYWSDPELIEFIVAELQELGGGGKKGL